MRALMLFALLALLPIAVAGGSAAQTAPSVPASPLRQTAAPQAAPAAAAPLQIGQTWLLEGKTDKGRTFRTEVVLGQVPAGQRSSLEAGFRQAAGAAKISALFAGTPRGAGTAQLLMLSRAGEQDMVVVMPSPSLEDVEAVLEEELSFCFLLADPGGRSFSGLSLRLREEGETYAVTGTVGSGGSERAELLSALRSAYTPLFGVGECRLARR